MTLHYGWSIQQLDVSNAFLDGTLDETIFMQQPLRLTNPQYLDHECCLKKTIYSLKQAPRSWFSIFSR